MRFYIDRRNRIAFFAFAFVLIFGIFLISFFCYLTLTRQIEDPVSIEGKYCSYRIDERIGRYHSRNIYLTLELQDGSEAEYLINVNLVFDEKEFFDQTDVGDHVKLTVIYDMSVVAVEANGRSYMTADKSFLFLDGGNAFLLLFGVILTIFGGIAAIAQIERKRGYRRRRRRKKV